MRYKQAYRKYKNRFNVRNWVRWYRIKRTCKDRRIKDVS